MRQQKTPEEYINAWTLNAEQHFEDGDYEWVCDQIESYHTILEIGCGAGYSTLVLTLRDHRVLSVDKNSTALQKTRDLIIESSYEAAIAVESIDFTNSDIWLWNADVVSDRDAIISVVKQLPIDLILLCNPGGNLDANIRMDEVKLLCQYGFSRKEIDCRYRQGAFDLLHKFSMIYAAADVAINCTKPLMVVERGSVMKVKDTLDLIAEDTKMRKVKMDCRRIRHEPEGGIPLGDIDGDETDDLYWGAGMYFPD